MHQIFVVVIFWFDFLYGMNKLFINIKKLNGIQPAGKLILKGDELNEMNSLENAFLETENGLIKRFGLMSEIAIDSNQFNGEVVDCNDREMFPAFADSHTHLVFAGTREEEFTDKINGLSYEAIAGKGGGILNSARRLNEMPQHILTEMAMKRLNDLQRCGTASVEIKSGYGLSVEGELKMLRVIEELKRTSSLNIKATFLGAHAIPAEYKTHREDYIKLIIEKMLPQIAKENLADYCDVFCEQGFFTKDETEKILTAAARFGLKAKIHANQLSNTGAVQTAVKMNALSVDHLEQMSETEIECLAKSNTIPTLLPAAAFFLRLPYPPARKMMEAGLPVTLATDFNPGSSPSNRMSFVLSLACIQMRMTPVEAFNAATLNGAAAMELSQQTGSITIGKQANLLLLKKEMNINHIPYFFGNDVIDEIYVKADLQSEEFTSLI